MVGLWVFRAYKYGRSGKFPMDKKPFITRIFFTFDSLDKFRNDCAEKYKPLYPDYCITYDKIFGTIDRY